VLISFLSSSYLIGCPTCPGQFKLKDDPFFSDSFYQSMQSSESYEALKDINLEEYDLNDDDDDNENEGKK